MDNDTLQNQVSSTPASGLLFLSIVMACIWMRGYSYKEEEQAKNKKKNKKEESGTSRKHTEIPCNTCTYPARASMRFHLFTRAGPLHCLRCFFLFLSLFSSCNILPFVASIIDNTCRVIPRASISKYQKQQSFQLMPVDAPACAHVLDANHRWVSRSCYFSVYLV